MPDRPYITLEAQDLYAERDPTKDNSVFIKEHKPTQLWYHGELIVLGRELCAAQTVFYPPDYELCSVMGKDQVCEGEGGTARIVWCTTKLATSKIYISLSATLVDGNYEPTAPTIPVDTQDLVQCHDFEFPVLAVDSKHYFKVESTDEDNETLYGYGVLCSGDTVVFTGGNLFVSVQILELIFKGTISPTVYPLTSSVAESAVDVSDEFPGIDGAAVALQVIAGSISRSVAPLTDNVVAT